MKRVIATFCALSISWSAFGASSISAELRSVDTLTKDQIPNGLNAALQATYDQLGCSGAFISNEGHFITAAHCMPITFNEQKFEQFGATVSIPTPAALDRVMRWQISNSSSRKQTQVLAKFKILAFGKGILDFSSLFDSMLRAPEATKTLLASGFGYSEDYAIIKFDDIKSDCVKISKKSVVEGDGVWTLGFPINKGGSGRMHWKTSPAVSFGKVTAGIQNNESARKVLNRYSPVQKAEILSALEAVRNPGLITSTLDGVGGLSGAPVFNEQGELVGVLNSGNLMGGADNLDHYVEGVAQSANIRHIVESTTASLGHEAAAEIFNCTNEK